MKLKLKLGSKKRFIEITLVYSVKGLFEREEFFLVNSEMLIKNQLSEESFIRFLKNQLPKKSAEYNFALKLWNSNLGVFSKCSVRELCNPELFPVSKIFNSTEEIFFRDKDK